MEEGIYGINDIHVDVEQPLDSVQACKSEGAPRDEVIV